MEKIAVNVFIVDGIIFLGIILAGLIINLLIKINDFRHNREWSKKKELLLQELRVIDRWCASDTNIVAVCERLKRVINNDPVENIDRWRDSLV